MFARSSIAAARFASRCISTGCCWNGLDGNAKIGKLSLKVTDTLYKLGGQLAAAGYAVEYQ